MFVLTLALVGNVNAAICTFTSPTTNENITSSPYTLDITCQPSSSDGAIYNVTFRYSRDGSSYTTIATVQNTTSNQTQFTYSWDWSSITNGMYYINATGYEYNISDGTLLSTGSDQESNVALDDTPPVFNSVSYTTNILESSTQSINFNVTDPGFSDSNGVRACVLTVVSNGLVSSSTHAASYVGNGVYQVNMTPAGRGVMKFKLNCTDWRGWSTETSEYTYRTYAEKSKEPRTVVVQPGAERAGGLRALLDWIRGLISRILGV